MLEIRGVCVRYGATQVLWDIDLSVSEGEVVAVMGPNGSGKSTIFKAVMGLAPPFAGAISFRGEDITRLPVEKHVARGIALVLERRRLFPTMTVRENVLMGAFHPQAAKGADEALRWLQGLFPVLRERGGQIAESLSGGEQQMVAIARGLMSRPRLLILDEPFLGLAPKMVAQVVDLIRAVNAEGIAVLFNEQNVRTSFSIADRGYVIESGRNVVDGTGLGMLEHPDIRRVYLGEQGAAP
ncbi:ABC transporter ATP-binding protein [Xanthobacter sp. KR7-225]|uniref:ABC transporter ATP-binding protein n=1 Tax=Xanthobacter sp. KR7-225 TaxID=3156613 RepID=UPI0032B3EF6D